MTAIRELIEAVERDEATTMKFDDALQHVRSERFGCGADIGEIAYHGSLDAALALMAAVLPNEEGWWWSIGHHDKEAPRYNAEVWRTEPHVSFYRQNPALADTPARALLLAILKAMEARG